ncbi:MAG TPA: metallophosphoesterase [Puia sp.]|nr:metallophosphoesterase [Puia sp.]
MRSSAFVWIILAIMVLLDFYVFQAVKIVAQNSSHKVKMIVYYSYWGISVAAIIILILIPFTGFENWPRVLRNYVLATILGLLFAKLLATVFFLVDDIRRIIQWASGKLFFRNTEGEGLSGEGISRSMFMSWLGLGVGGGLFSTLMYGFSNKYNYQVRRIQLSFENLPKSFKGLKLVQISDIHSGSFNNKSAVNKGIDKILKENADLILFTGDLVNDRAVEMHDYMDVFSRLKAPMGVYSTLGNHDYGDYYYGAHPVGERAVEKANNLQRVKEIHEELGWRLLLDEHVKLERNGEHIALIGVQNISGRRGFQTYGSLGKAYSGAEHSPFKILMSHDPSHWDVEVLPKYPDIDLALAGHTHGMQFGVELPGFKWSPVEYVYKEWAGLYEKGNQKLYVNRGYGFIGYPGRVGILPEITVIELI